MLVAVACLFANPALAQVTPPTPLVDGQEPRIQLRGFSATPTLSLTNIGVDTNVFNTPANPQSDFTMTLSPGVDVWLRLGRARLTARGRSDLVYFRRYASERSLDGGVGARLEVPFNRVMPWVEGGSFSGRQRAGYEVDLRSRRTQRRVAMGVAYRAGSKTTLGAEVRRMTSRWDGDAVFFGNSLNDALARRTDEVAVTYRQNLTVLTTFVAEASAATDRFQFATERDTDSVRAIVGFDLNQRALIDGSGRIGFRKFDGVGRGYESFQGLVASADLGYVLRGVTRFGVQVDRDAAFSFFRDYPYFLQTGVTVSVTQRVTNRWDVQGRMGHQNLAYRTLIGSITAVDNRVDQVDTIGSGVGYRLNSDLRLGVDVDKFRRRSQFQARDYERFRIGASVTYAR